MKQRGLQTGIRTALVCAGVAFGAYAAQAQSEVTGPTTVHSFTVDVKAALQDERGNGRGETRESREKIVLVTDCGDAVAPFKALVLVVDTDEERKSSPTSIATLDPVATKENND